MMYKVIDELCDISTRQMELIREMSALLMQSDVPNMAMDEITAQIAEIENEMDASEYHLRRIGR